MIQPKSNPSFGAFEAKTHLSELLNRVERGDRILITRHGRAIAALVPVQTSSKKNLVALSEHALEITQGTHLPKGKTMKDLINAGRSR